MTDLTTINKRLQDFGLTKKQSDIYILLLREGNLRISRITQLLNMPRSSVYESLKGLFERGLAEEIIENSYKHVKAYPIGSIRHILDEQVEALRKQTSDLDHLEKSLSILPGIQAPAATIIRYYKGKAGARQLFWNTLKAKDTLYVQSEWGRGKYVGMEFYKRFVAESYAKNVNERVLTNPTPHVLDSIRQYTGTPVSRTNLDTIRCIDKEEIPFKGETLIYDNVYAQIFLKNEQITGFEVESKQFVRTQRSIFEVLWSSATPVSELL